MKPISIQYEQAIVNLNEKIMNIELLFNKEKNGKNEFNKRIKTLEEKLEKKDIIIHNLIERINTLEKQMEKQKETKETFINKINSVIIKRDEYNLIKEGIKHNFNKSIRNFELLIRGSEDGFKSKDFHEKCDNQSFTVAFVETTDGKRFRGLQKKFGIKVINGKKTQNHLYFLLIAKKSIIVKKVEMQFIAIQVMTLIF